MQRDMMLLAEPTVHWESRMRVHVDEGREEGDSVLRALDDHTLWPKSNLGAI